MMKHLYLLLLFLSIHIHSNAQSTGSENEWLLGTGETHDAAYSPDGKYIATVGDVGLHIWDIENLKLIDFSPNDKGLNFIKWSRDSSKLFVSKIELDELFFSSSRNFIFQMNDNSIIAIDETIRWLSHGLGVSSRRFVAFVSFGYIDFSSDASEVIFVNANNEIVIYNTLSGSEIETVKNFDNPVVSAGFMEDDNTIWYQESTLNDNLFFYSRSTKEIIDQRRIEVNVLDITQDDTYIYHIRGQAFHSGLTNTNLFATDLKTNNKFDLSFSSRIFDPGYFIPPKSIYLQKKSEFITLNNISVVSAVNRGVIQGQELTTTTFGATNLSTRFTQPFSNDGSIYLAGNNATDFRDNLIFPSYGVYAVHWEDESYEHLLPRTSPKLIAFDNSLESKYIIHTNRETKQYSKRIVKTVPGESTTETIQNLTIIPNKYSHPIAEIWSPDDQTVVSEVLDKPFYEIGVFSSDNQLFASPIEPISATQSQLNIYDTESWESVFELPVDATNTVNCIAFSPDDNLFLAAHESVELWDIANGEKTHTFSQHDGSVYHAEFSDDSKHVLSCGSDGQLLVYDLAFNSANTLIEESSPIIFAKFLGGESQIIYTLDNGATNVIDVSSGEIVSEIPAELGEHTFRAVKLSADQHYLIVGNQIWDLATAEQINTIAAFAEPIEDLQVSSDGKWIATRHSDFTARVWHTVDVFQRDTAVVEFERY